MNYDMIVEKQKNRAVLKTSQIGATVLDREIQIIEPTLENFGDSISFIRIEDDLNQNHHNHDDCIKYTTQIASHHNIPVLKKIDVPKGLINHKNFTSHLQKCSEMGLSGILVKPYYDDESGVADIELVKIAGEHDLRVYFEIEDRNLSQFSDQDIDRKIDGALKWVERGAVKVIAQATSPGEIQTTSTGRGKPNDNSAISVKYAELLVTVFGLQNVLFKAATTFEQSELLSHFGKNIQVCEVPLSNIPIVEQLKHRMRPALVVPPPDLKVQVVNKESTAGPSEREKWRAQLKAIL